MSKKGKDDIVISRKALMGMAMAMPIIGVLLSKRQAGPLVLFLIGISIGVWIGRTWREK
jgi:hypothetical protein